MYFWAAWSDKGDDICSDFIEAKAFANQPGGGNMLFKKFKDAEAWLN